MNRSDESSKLLVKLFRFNPAKLILLCCLVVVGSILTDPAEAACFGNNTCNAQKVTVGTIVVNPQSSDPTCTDSSDSIDISLTIPIGGSSAAYDLAVLIATNGAGVINGTSCVAENKPLPSNLEGQCGDKSSGDQTWVTDTYTVSCIDSDLDGFLDIDVGLAVNQNASSFNDKTSCNVDAIISGTSSQCKVVENLNTTISVPIGSTKSADVRIEKTFVNGSNFVPGDTGSYKLKVCNDGPDDIIGAKVEDTLPNGVTIDANWSCVADANSACISGGASGSGSTGSGNIMESVDLDNGSCVEYTVPVKFASDASAY